MAVDSAFSEYSRVHGFQDAFAAFCADSAMMMPVRREPVVGRDSIKALLAGMENVLVTWQPAGSEMSSSGDLGYTWGRSVFTERDSTGTEQSSYGKYVTIWKKQADGTWKFVVDIGNANPAPPKR